jgi:hypothetical protein
MYILSFDVASKSLAVSIIKFNENWRADVKQSIEILNQTLCLYTSISNKPNIDSFTKICQASLIHINNIHNILDTLIQIIFVDVVDLIPGKKIKETDLILRSNRLKGYLNNLDNMIKDFDACHVLVEYQMGPNNKSNNVFSQILYHYSEGDLNFANTYDSIYIIKNTSDSNPINKNKSESNPIIKNTSEHKNKKLKDNTEPKKTPTLTIEIVGPSLKNKLNLDKDRPRTYFIEKYAKTYDANKKHSISNMNYFLKTKKAEYMIANIKNKNLDDIADSITMTLAWIYLKSNLI